MWPGPFLISVNANKNKMGGIKSDTVLCDYVVVCFVHRSVCIHKEEERNCFTEHWSSARKLSSLTLLLPNKRRLWNVSMVACSSALQCYIKLKTFVTVFWQLPWIRNQFFYECEITFRYVSKTCVFGGEVTAGAWRGGNVDVSYEQISPQKLAHTRHGIPSRFMKGCFPVWLSWMWQLHVNHIVCSPAPQPITYNTVHITLCGQSDVNGCMQFNWQPVLCLLNTTKSINLSGRIFKFGPLTMTAQPYLVMIAWQNDQYKIKLRDELDVFYVTCWENFKYTTDCQTHNWSSNRE